MTGGDARNHRSTLDLSRRRADVAENLCDGGKFGQGRPLGHDRGDYELPTSRSGSAALGRGTAQAQNTIGQCPHSARRDRIATGVTDPIVPVVELGQGGSRHLEGEALRSTSQRSGIRRDVDSVLLEYIEGNDSKGSLMRGGKHDIGSSVVLMGPQPVDGCHAPTVAGHQTGEAVLRDWRAQVVADPPLMLEELLGHHGADRVAPSVLRSGAATPVAKKAGDRVAAAALKLASKHVTVDHRGEYHRSREQPQRSAGHTGCTA